MDELRKAQATSTNEFIELLTGLAKEGKVLGGWMQTLVTREWIKTLSLLQVKDLLDCIVALGLNCEGNARHTEIALRLLNQLVDVNKQEIKPSLTRQCLTQLAESNLKWSMISTGHQRQLMAVVTAACCSGEQPMDAIFASLILQALHKLQCTWIDLPMELQHELVRALFVHVPRLESDSEANISNFPLSHMTKMGFRLATVTDPAVRCAIFDSVVAELKKVVPLAGRGQRMYNSGAVTSAFVGLASSGVKYADLSLSTQHAVQCALKDAAEFIDRSTLCVIIHS